MTTAMYVHVARAVAASAVAISILTSFPYEGSAILPFQQFETAGDIPDSLYRDHATLHGRVVRVIDGDTIRVRHVPWYPLPFGQRYVGRMSEHTLSVRAYGVDCPEMGKFGKPSQAFAVEAKAFTKQLLQDRVVTIKLLRKDQYNRAVAKIQVKSGWIPFLQKDLTMELAERGYAVMYNGRGAEYDDNRDLLEQKISFAKQQGRGIWSLDTDKLITPEQFKREQRALKSSFATSI